MECKYIDDLVVDQLLIILVPAVLLTVILQLTSVFFDLTFILQVPGDFAVISPSEVTEAILLLVLLYVGILPFEVNAAR